MRLGLWMAICACLIAGEALAADGAIRPLELKAARFNLKDGDVWGQWGDPITCDVFHRDLRWRGAKAAASAEDISRLSAVFDEELVSAHLKSPQSESLFERETSSGGLQVGAVIKDLKAKLCGNWSRGVSELAFRVSAEMQVEWQVFDPARQEVVARLQTSAKAESTKKSDDALERIVVSAFRENARALLADPELLRLAHGSEASTVAGRPEDKTPIKVGVVRAPSAAISDAAGSVVTIFSDDGHGSGFLISGDGYFLTNRHVVGTSKSVRLRWSDGFETTGEVVRSDKRRDVALIKAAPHSRQPLALRADLARPGDAVFAIGTPLDASLQGTLTKGVLSAYRVTDGLNFLQSDVNVNHGNSGGPLLDDKGRVIGITVSGLGQGDVQLGFNFFIPIGDALDFLNLVPAV